MSQHKTKTLELLYIHGSFYQAATGLHRTDCFLYFRPITANESELDAVGNGTRAVSTVLYELRTDHKRPISV
jgi:hypothetical protein